VGFGGAFKSGLFTDERVWIGIEAGSSHDRYAGAYDASGLTLVCNLSVSMRIMCPLLYSALTKPFRVVQKQEFNGVG
jgi:hypothetical protein